MTKGTEGRGQRSGIGRLRSEGRDLQRVISNRWPVIGFGACIRSISDRQYPAFSIKDLASSIQHPSP
jgi:hypothetical protein